MQYIFESVLVGIYSCLLYSIIKIYITNLNSLLFLTGFFKHMFGYLFNIHTLYCNYGYACNSDSDLNNKQYKKALFTNYLWIESIIEGLGYLFFGLILNTFKFNKTLVVFLIGMLLHLLFEKLKIHQIFCKNRCV